MPKVSVIIPVYNTESYLRRCLDSVCNQTLKDIEVVCVDDCSTDNSLEILRQYAQNYPQMKVIQHEKNGGESVARNTGLAAATGEYIGFVDNDDEVDLDFYEKLYSKAIEDNADIVKGNTLTINLDNTQHYSYLNKNIRDRGKWFFNYEWWSAIYKSSIIRKHNLQLPEGFVLGGDVLFLNEFLAYADKITVVDDVSYCWLRRENSGESPILSFEKVQSALKIFDQIQNNANNLWSESLIDEKSYDFLMTTCMWVAIEYIFRNDILESKKLCCEYLIKYYENCKRQEKLAQYILEKAPYLYSCFNKFDLLLEKVQNIKNKNEFEKRNIFTSLRLKMKEQ